MLMPLEKSLYTTRSKHSQAEDNKLLEYFMKQTQQRPKKKKNKQGQEQNKTKLVLTMHQSSKLKQGTLRLSS